VTVETYIFAAISLSVRKSHSLFLYLFAKLRHVNRTTIHRFMTSGTSGQIISNAILIMVLIIRDMEPAQTFIISFIVFSQFAATFSAIYLLIKSTDSLYQCDKDVYKIFASFSIYRMSDQNRGRYLRNFKKLLKVQIYYEILCSKNSRFCFKFRSLGRARKRDVFLKDVAVYSCLLMYLLPYLKNWKSLNTTAMLFSQ